MLSLCMALDHTYLMWYAYNNLSWVVNNVGRILLLPRKSVPDSTSQFGWVAHGTHLSFSPNTTIEVVGLSQASIDGRLLGLLSPYHQYAICTFNTCSWEPTHQSLTDIGGGYNLGGADLPYHTPWPFQLIVSTFHLRAPLDLRLSIQSLPAELKREQILNLTSGSLHSTSTVSYHLSIACANGNHQDDRVIKDKPEGQS
jgi:hypothetical protein